MKRAVLVGLGVVLVLLGLLSLQFLGDPPPTTAAEDSMTTAAPMQTSLPSENDVETAEATDRARLDSVAQTAAVPGSLIVEVVFEGTATGVPGVGVTAIPQNGRSRLLGLRQQVTDEGGRAVFDGLGPGVVEVAVGRIASARAEVDPGSNVHVRLAVPPGIRLEGEVVGPEGDPVAGAQVLYWDRVPSQLPVPVAVTDALGRFSIDPYLRLGPVSATAEGYLPSPRYSPAIADGERMERFSQAPPASVTDLTIFLRIELGSEPGIVNGIVVGDEGAPVEGALVTTTPPRSRIVRDAAGNRADNDQPAVRVTGDDGRFSVPAVPGTSLRVLAAGYAPHGQALDVTLREHRDLRVVLVASAGIQGRVRSTTGESLGGATVGTSGYGSIRVTTAGDGSYHLDAVAVGDSIQVYASDPDHLIQRATLPVGPEVRTEWNPELEPLARLRGRVVDEVGRALAGWTVQIDPPTQPMRSPYVRVSSETAEDGGFDLGVVPDKPYVLKLREPGQWISPDLSALGELYGEREDLLIIVDSDMRATSYIRGILRDDTGQPLDGVSLQLYVGPLTARLDVKTDGSGAFEIGPIVARHYRLQASGSPRNLPRIDLIEFDLEPRQELDLGELTIASQGTLAYSVRGPDGEQIPGQLNGFLHSDLSTLETSLFFDAQGNGTATVPSGAYTLQVMASGYMRVARNIEVRAGQETTLNLRLFAGDMVRLLPVLPDDPGLTDEEHVEARTLHPDGDWTEYLHGIAVDGTMYDQLMHSVGNLRPWSLNSVLAPGSYTLEITSESGKVFAGAFAVREGRDPDDVITVHCLVK